MPLLSRPLRRAALATLLSLTGLAQAAPLLLQTETEPNNKRGQATRVVLGEVGTLATGAIGGKTDVDFFRLDLAIGQCVAIGLTPNPLVDTDIELQSAIGLTLARSEERGLAQIEQLATCGLPLSQTYYLKVYRFSGKTGPVFGGYALEVVPVDALP